jgi:hypothetical protein
MSGWNVWSSIYNTRLQTAQQFSAGFYFLVSRIIRQSLRDLIRIKKRHRLGKEQAS